MFNHSQILLDLSKFNEKDKITLPHVESLKLDLYATLPDQFWEGFFSMLPGVRIIEVDGSAYQNWEVIANAMAKLKIHTFHHPCKYAEQSVWGAMAQKHSLKLKNLSMCLKIDERDPHADVVLGKLKAQVDFLKSQSESLEVLSLDVLTNTPYQYNFQIQWPVMKKLKNAKFHYGTSYGKDNIAKLEPEQIPELRTLSSTSRTITNRRFLADSLFPNVQEIKLLDWNLFCCPLLRQVVSKFPNLRKVTNIEVRADCSEMELIFTNLGSIEDLELKLVDHAGYNCTSDKNFDFNLAVSGIPGGSNWVLSQLADRVGYEALALWIDPPRQSLRDLKRKYYLTCSNLSVLIVWKYDKS